MAEQQQTSVKIHLYDLSQGMARTYSPQLLGRQIDGIWHTGVVVYGNEYFYGGGICKDIPGKTPYGNPFKVIDMGQSEIPKEMFHQFLQDISPKYAPDKYDLFKNNCNNFSDDCCQILVGQSIPSYITSLPETVLNTQFGKMIKPMIDNMQQQIVQQTYNQQMFPGGGVQPMPNFNELQNQMNMHFQNQQNNQYQQQSNTQSQSAVIEVTNLIDYLKIINESLGVVTDFFSFSCPPCMKIKPFFAQLANEFKISCPQIKFLSVNVQTARDIATKFQIQSIPTFYFYYNKEVINKFSGANQNELRRCIYQIKQKIEDNNPEIYKQNNQNAQGGLDTQFQNFGFKFNLFNPSSNEIYHFRNPLEKPISKIKQIIESKNQPELKNVLDTITNNSSQKKEILTSIIIEQKQELVKFLSEQILENSQKSEEWGAVLDLLKELVLDIEFATKFTNSAQILNETHQKVFVQVLIKNFEKSARGIKILILRLFNNLFQGTSEIGAFFIMKYLRELVKMIETTLSAHSNDKVSLHTIVSLIYNIFIKQQNFKLNDLEANYDIKQKLINAQLSILKQEAVNEANINLCLAMSLSQISYKNDEVIKQLQTEKVIEIFSEKLKNNTDQSVKQAFEDLDNVLKGRGD